MKTAMQELLDELEEVSNIGENPFIKTTVNLIIDMVEDKINKEKQQIIDLCAEAYYLGLGHKDYNPEKNYDSTFGDSNEAGI